MKVQDVAELNEERAERKRMKTVLWRWGRVSDYCKRRHAEIAELQQLLDGIADLRAGSGQAVTVGGGRIGDPTYCAAEKLVELGGVYDGRISELVECCEREQAFARSVDDAIKTLPPIHQNILELRYRQGKAWSLIGDKLGYAEDYVELLHRKILDALCEIITAPETDLQNGF